MDVNGEESRLSLVESREEDLSRVVETNPDCYVVVYAVDNEDSFGEKEQRQELSVANLVITRICQEDAGLADLQQQPGRQEQHPGGEQGRPGQEQVG